MATHGGPLGGGADRRFGARLRSFLRSATGRSSGPVLMALAAAVPVVEFRVAGVLLGGGIVAFSHVAVQRHMRMLEEENQRSVEDEVCEVLIHNINFLEHLKRVEGGLFRASVLLVDPQRQALVFRMGTHGFADREREIVWSKGQGPPGMAWQLGRPVVAPVTEEGGWRTNQAQNMPLLCSAERGNGSAEGVLSESQLRFLTSVGMMVCFPIFDLHRASRIVGVLTLDDRIEPGQHLAEIMSAAEFLRDEVRRLLGRGQAARIGVLAGDA